MRLILLAFILLAYPSMAYAEQRLFILSGQSNMVMLNPTIIFNPMIEKQYGQENVTVVHDAENGKAIDNWDEGAWLWIRLIDKITVATQGKQITNVTFVWMQGEADCVYPDTYENKLTNLFSRVEMLFPQAKTSYVVGRITDWYKAAEIPGWAIVRETQMNVCGGTKSCKVVNTDDLNGIEQDIHFMGNYDILAQRFASASITLAEKKNHFPLSMMVASDLR